MKDAKHNGHSHKTISFLKLRKGTFRKSHFNVLNVCHHALQPIIIKDFQDMRLRWNMIEKS